MQNSAAKMETKRDECNALEGQLLETQPVQLAQRACPIATVEVSPAQLLSNKFLGDAYLPNMSKPFFRGNRHAVVSSNLLST